MSVCSCGSGAKARKVKCACADARLCETCTMVHRCPSLVNVDRKQWLREHAPEEELTTAVIAALLKLEQVRAVWQAKKRGGVRANDAAGRVPDILGYVEPGARMIAVETKRAHAASCKCESCEGQRKWGARLVAAGGVYLADVRSVGDAVERLRAALGAT